MTNRRDFLRKALQTGAALALSPLMPQAPPPTDCWNILQTKDFITFTQWEPGVKAGQILMYANLCIVEGRPQYEWKPKVHN